MLKAFKAIQKPFTTFHLFISLLFECLYYSFLTSDKRLAAPVAIIPFLCPIFLFVIHSKTIENL